MDVFAVGAAGELLQASWDLSGFAEFVSLGMPAVPIPGLLAACNCGYGTLALVTRGVLGDLLLKWWNGNSWSPFSSLGAPQ